LSFVGAQRVGKQRLWALLFVIAIFFSAYSIFLAVISKYYIKAYCLMCIAGYGINFGLLYLIWIVRRRFPEKGFFRSLILDIRLLTQKMRRFKYLVFCTLLILLPALIFFPNYWQFDLPPISSEMATGLTEDGSPWIGAKDPVLVITEYSDYQCFQCRKTHIYLRQIVMENSDKIRLVHRHFPMDPKLNPLVSFAFHPGSGKLAMAAAYAALEDRFWQMNDQLYDIPRNIKYIDIKDLAQKTGVSLKGLSGALGNKQVYVKIRQDIIKGIKIGVTGTPAYEIDGKLYQGKIPVDVIKTIIE
jgi:hypothetical protein